MIERVSYGGFIYENVKRWIQKECVESGDPDNFFMMIEDVVDDIRNEMDTHYWVRLEGDL